MGRSISLTRDRLDLPDFCTYYLTARMLEISPSGIYDNRAMDDLRTAAGVPDCPLPYSYPPFFAGCVRLLARLPYQQAAAVWMLLNVICLVGGLVGLLALTGWPGGRVGVVVALLLLLLFVPAQEAVLLGQVSPLLFLLNVFALLLLDRSKSTAEEVTAGILLGAATFIKVVPVILLVYLLLRRRWLAVVGGVLGGALCMLVGLLWGGGWSNTWTYFTAFLPSLYTSRLTRVALDNQALTALFLRPLGDSPLSRVLGLGAVLAVSIVTWLASFVRHPRRLTREFALISMLSLLVPSSVYGHMYISILLPIALLTQSWYNGTRWLAAPLLLSFLLLIVNSYSKWASLRLAIWVPFGLIGTLIVWGALLRQVTLGSDGCGLENG
ncbi:MAG: DUF2029 domain-containing protein [Chloroflexi bacterium]|nr:DUF2029 domain-containing protein [Chloroflexota bacterium]